MSYYKTFIALQRIARMMSRDYGIVVKFSGSSAYTDGKIINLPILIDAPKELIADLNGYLDHEVAHCKYSDFTQINKCRNLFHKHFVNAIEDSRIELLLPEEFPGTKYNLLRLNDKLGEKIRDNFDKLPWPIRFVLACREVYDGRVPIVDENLALLFEPLKPKILKLRDCKTTGDIVRLTSEIMDDINRIRKGLSEDAEVLTEEEMELLQQMGADLPMGLPREAEEGQKGTSNSLASLDPAAEKKNKGKGKKGEGEASSDGEGDSEDGSSDMREGNPNAKHKNDGRHNEAGGDIDPSEKDGKSYQGQKEGDSDGNTSGAKEGGFSRENKTNASSDEALSGKSVQSWQETEDEASMLNDPIDAKNSDWEKNVHSAETMIGEALDEHIKQEVKSEGDFYTGSSGRKGMKPSLPFTTEHDVIKDFNNTGDPSQYASLKNEVMPMVNPLKTAFARMLQVEENKRTKFDQERGQINRKALANLIADKQFRRPFKESTKEITNNVAVSLVVDCSGSMSGYRINLAKQTAIALAETLKSLDMQFEVVGFSTTNSDALSSAVSQAQREGQDLSRFNRTDGALELFVFKSFETANPIGISNIYSSGANGDGESVLWAGHRLAKRKENRKLMFVLSDGRPSMYCKSDSLLEDDLRRVVQKVLPDMGIEPFGIGIETRAVEQFYPEYVVVNNVDELPKVVMTQLIQKVMKSWQKTR